MKVWTVHCKIGVYWDGPEYFVGTYSYRWIAHLRAKLHLIRYPYRQCIISPVGFETWHPVWREGQVKERRILSSWFSDHPLYRETAVYSSQGIKL